MIGHLAKSVKSARKNPEASIVLKHVARAGTRRDMLSKQVKHEEEHPLVPLGAIHSLSERYLVGFPKLTHGNSIYLFKSVLSEIRRSVLEPIFGAARCAYLAGKHPGALTLFSVRATNQRVSVGPWTYSNIEREGMRFVFESRSSWFRILASNVPHFAKDNEVILAAEPDLMLYGRFQRFLEVKVPQWRRIDYYGECTLYAAKFDEAMLLPVIDLTQPAQWSNPRLEGPRPARIMGALDNIKYVRLNKVEGQICLGPMYQGLLKQGKQAHTVNQLAVAATKRYAVLQMDK